MICPYNDGSIIRTREFEYNKEGKVIKQTERVQQIPMECLRNKCPFYDGYNYSDCACKRVANDVGGDI